MPPEQKPRERRRGERVLLRVPIHITATGEDDSPVDVDAEAVIVSSHGALIRTRILLKLGSSLTLRHGFTGDTIDLRVVWNGQKPVEGVYDIGLEFIKPSPEFWGIKFPPSSP